LHFAQLHIFETVCREIWLVAPSFKNGYHCTCSLVQLFLPEAFYI
jgi:hypothetical protein